MHSSRALCLKSLCDIVRGGTGEAQRLQKNTSRCSAAHCTALHWTAHTRTALHCAALHYTALRCTALHCAALHCTALHTRAAAVCFLGCSAALCQRCINRMDPCGSRSYKRRVTSCAHARARPQKIMMRVAKHTRTACDTKCMFRKSVFSIL